MIWRALRLKATVILVAVMLVGIAYLAYFVPKCGLLAILAPPACWSSL